MATKYPQRTFRPWPENQAHFEFAEQIKLNVSELLNEIVARHFQAHIKRKTTAMQRAASLAPKSSTKLTTSRR